jgi:hypothetical protein
MLNMDSKSYYQSAFNVNGFKAVAAQVWPESHGFYPVRVALQSNPLVYEASCSGSGSSIYEGAWPSRVTRLPSTGHPGRPKGYTPTFQRGLHCWDMGLAGVVEMMGHL